MNKIDINEAATVVMTAERDALDHLKTVLDKLDADLAEIDATLPATLNLDAKRIVNEVRGSVAYRRGTEIPGLLTRYEAPPVA